MKKIEILKLSLRNKELMHQAAEIFVKRFGPGSFYNDPWTFESVVQHVFRENNKKRHGKLFVAIEGGKVVGVGGGHAFSAFLREWGKEHLLTEHLDQFKSLGRTYYLDFVAIHPEYENRGIGRKLSEAREVHARNLGYRSVALRTIHPAREKLAINMGYKLLFKHSGSGRVATSTVTERKYFAKKL